MKGCTTEYIEQLKDLALKTIALDKAIGALEKEERMSNVLTMLSIQAEQHKMILASDIFDILEDIYPNWNSADDN